MTTSLVLTLGHNASAIVVDDGHILGGYEEERFTGKKSDSSFPVQSITRLREYTGIDKFDDICIGHWFTAGNVVETKYVDIPYLESLVADKSDIHSITDGFTHHDSHMLSAKVFADYYRMPKDCMTIIADGFGTFGECISIYQQTPSGTKLLSRFFGFDKSLGLLYQYATAFLQMKMNNHEYKMLGYEAHIDEVLSPVSKAILLERINVESSAWLKNMFNNPISMTHDPLVNVAALAETQNGVGTLLSELLKTIDPNDEFSLHKKRIVVSYFVQGIVESVIGSLVGLHRPKNLVVSGGLFYNVKLNHRLADMVDKFCVMPLAGDQGAGLGVYEQYHSDLAWPGHLNWGHRDLSEVIKSPNLVVMNDEDLAAQFIDHELNTKGYVNLVRGAMEFGPRSLCNTATLALPTMRSVNDINNMNDRTTVMPMAPVMSENDAYTYLQDCDKIVGSLEYMIVTRNVDKQYVNDIKGASHYYSESDRYTCRPQISHDGFMGELLDLHGPLINTSFNYHGVPIVFDAPSIKYSHEQQNKVTEIRTVVLY